MLETLSLLKQVKLSSVLRGSYLCKVATQSQSADHKVSPDVCTE